MKKLLLILGIFLTLWVNAFAVVPNATPLKNVYTCNSSTLQFPYQFPITAASDITVWLTDANGNSSQVTSNFSVDTTNLWVNYPISGSACATGNTLTLLPQTPQTQTTTYSNRSPFTATVVGSSLDKLTMITQQLQEQVNRSILGPVNATNTNYFPSALPGYVLGWSPTGTLQNYLPNTSAYITTSTNATMGGNSPSSSVIPTQSAINAYVKSRTQFNVLDYGADSTGVADSTTAINNTLTAARAVNGAVYFPPGTYLVTSTIVLQAGDKLIGSNKSPYAQGYTGGYCTIYFNPSTVQNLFDAVTNANGNGYVNNIYIGGFFLKGNTVGGGTNSQYALYNSAGLSIFENLSIVQFQIGIYTNYDIQSMYRNIFIQNMTVAGIEASNNTNTTDVFDTVWVDTCPWGAILQHTVGYRFINGLWQNMSIGGVNIYRNNVGLDFVSNYLESGGSASYGMFYVGHSGSSGSPVMSIIGGTYNGGNIPSGSFIDVGYCKHSDSCHIYVAPGEAFGFTNGVKVDSTNVDDYTTEIDNFDIYSSATNATVNAYDSNNGYYRIYGHANYSNQPYFTTFKLNIAQLLLSNNGVANLANVRYQTGAVVTNSGSTMTLTGTQIVANSIFQETGTTAATFTLDTGANITTAVLNNVGGTVNVGTTVSFAVSNASTQTITMTGASGANLANAMTVTSLQSRTFYAINTGTNTWVIY